MTWGVQLEERKDATARYLYEQHPNGAYRRKTGNEIENN